ncbi:MAG: hypothetical protein H0U52_15580 [Chloroflexi bacterium]|nr:hypothetical protein [Chloroflexota bacterium]
MRSKIGASSIHSRDLGWVLTLLVAGIALLVGAGAIAIRLLGPSELAVIPAEAWPWTADGVEVAATSGRSAFLAGDLVVGMNGRPLASWVEAAMPFASAPDPLAPGAVVTFDVVRDGRSIQLPVALQTFPFDRLGPTMLPLVGFGAGVLALAAVLVARRPRSTVLRLLFVAAAANAADISAWTIGLQPTDFLAGSPFLLAFGAAAIFNVVFWSSIVHILTVYPVRSPIAVRHRAVVPLIHVLPLAALAVLVLIANLAGGSTLVKIDRLASVVAIVGSGMLVTIILATIAGYRRATPPMRRSVRWIAAGLVFAAVATLAFLTLPIVVTGEPLLSRSLVDLFAMPVPVAILIAVARDRLFQVALLTRSRERIVAAREDERRKLRRDLHDGLAPTLAAAGLKLDHARHVVRTDPAAAENAIDDARQAVRGTIAEIRRLSRELRPPALDTLGLVGAIREQAEGLGGQAGNGPLIIVDAPDALPSLAAAVEVAAYRIAVEGMMNVVRHAAATTCQVSIGLADGELRIEVADDGVGIQAEGGVGLRSMRERAAEIGGDVTFDAGSGQGSGPGTRLTARLPVAATVMGSSLT